MFRRDFVASVVGAVVAWVSTMFGKRADAECTEWEVNVMGDLDGRMYIFRHGRIFAERLESDRLIRWIPVTERLPELSNHTAWKQCAFLVRVEWQRAWDIPGYTTIACRCAGVWKDASGVSLGEKGPASLEKVTHWAKLPAPPDEIHATST